MSIFVPPLAYISSITNAQYAVVTFTEDHYYSNGEILSFRVSEPYGMVEMNNQQARVLATTSDSVTVDIDSLNYTAFTNVGTAVAKPAIAVPVGSGIILNYYPPTINLEDVFDDVPTT